MSALVADPLLWVGLDIGVKRDTSAVAAWYQDYETGQLRLWGHKIWTPPVNLYTQVEPVLFRLLRTQRVVALLFDPYQFEASRQRLAEAGYGHKLIEVNQMTQMVPAASTLHAHIVEKKLRLYNDGMIRAHFGAAVFQETERGPRVKKKKQSKPIDFVVASMMALLGATEETGQRQLPSLSPLRHTRSITDLEVAA